MQEEGDGDMVCLPFVFFVLCCLFTGAPPCSSLLQSSSSSVSRELGLSPHLCKLCDQPSSSQGASGIGLGNFQEIGPLDVDLKPRNSTWLQKADLIFLVSHGERQP